MLKAPYVHIMLTTPLSIEEERRRGRIICNSRPMPYRLLCRQNISSRAIVI